MRTFKKYMMLSESRNIDYKVIQSHVVATAAKELEKSLQFLVRKIVSFDRVDLYISNIKVSQRGFGKYDFDVIFTGSDINNTGMKTVTVLDKDLKKLKYSL